MMALHRFNGGGVVTMAIMILIFYDYDNPYDCDDYNYIDSHYDDNEGGDAKGQ